MRNITAALTVFALGAPLSVLAVCVEGHIRVEAEVGRSWAIVIGRVESEREVPPPPGDEYPGTEYRLKVLEILRGEPQSDINLFSEHTSGAFPMDVGATYLAFVQRDKKVAFIDYCGNSGRAEKSQALVRELRATSGKPT
jgi:hypothetical protein